MTGMTRRLFAFGAAAIGGSLIARPRNALALQPDPPAFSADQQAEIGALRARMFAALPFERVTVPGQEAMREWSRLRARGLPIIIGSDEDLERIAEQFSIDDKRVFGAGAAGGPMRSIEEILVAAARLRFPEDQARWAGDRAASDFGAPVGDWPGEGAETSQPTIGTDPMRGAPFERVHILLIPTDQSWKVPAYLRWGGWNACPPPEYHVAALQAWQHRYGADLVGLNGDTLNLRVARRPESRAEALALAREHYLYCPDTVDQGVGTLSALAHQLIVSEWWTFWWD